MAGNFHESFERPEIPLPSDRSTGIVFVAMALVAAYIWRSNSALITLLLGMAAILLTISILAPSVLRPLVQPSRLKTSLTILDRFSQRFDMRMIWVSTREELQERDPRRAVVAAALSARKLAPTLCPLPTDGYLPRDGHPNAKGNAAILKCVTEAAREW